MSERHTVEVSPETLDNIKEIIILLKKIDPYSEWESQKSACARAIACYRGRLEEEVLLQKRVKKQQVKLRPGEHP